MIELVERGRASLRGFGLLPLVLWVLLGAFCLRVLGQFIAVVLDTNVLGTRDDWTSGIADEFSAGLIPYPALLVVQLGVVALLGKACVDFSRRCGLFFVPRHTLGSWLLAFGSLYLGVMVIRYALRMGLYPRERWAGGSASIFSHWAVAISVLSVGRFHRSRGETPATRRSAWTRWAVHAGRLVAALSILGVICAWVAYQLAPTLFARRLDIRRPEYAIRVQRGVSMTTSDGVKLVSDIFHPAGARRTPTILVRINYSKTLTTTLIETIAGRLWAERGYTTVIQGTRGRYESGGSFHPFATERQDGIETLAWVKRQPWYDGRLGMWGGSYFGYTQWVLFDQVDPRSSAFMIQIASSDFHGMFYPGGAFSLESALFWAVRSHEKTDVTPAQKDLARGYDGFPLSKADDRAVGSDIPFFDEWVNHPTRDAYWAHVDGSGRARRLRAPVLLMGGWFDAFLPTELHDFETIRRDADPRVASATRLIIGPWGHARTPTLPGGVKPRNYRLESIAPSVAWFDQRLLGRRSPGRRPAPIRFYELGANVWRDAWQWPLARTRFTSFYLRSDGSANSSAGNGTLARVPPATGSHDTYTYDPRDPVPTRGGAMLGPRSGIFLQNDVERRRDVLVYTTPPLSRDVEVTGPIKLVLYVSSTARSTDFTGKLVDVYPDGRAYNVSDGILRVALTPVRRRQIEIELWPTSMLFRKSHRIRLEVSSSNYPRFDRNPNTGGDIATATHPVTAAETVYDGAATPSRLILPVIPRAKPSA